mmetsp:Transcript_54546/g.116544  ORF Transcript_54546/g.116544 Transcript_54546/m.116544 type:complete len:473 (-) Transcript_54546:90-1508(-)
MPLLPIVLGCLVLKVSSTTDQFDPLLLEEVEGDCEDPSTCSVNMLQLRSKQQHQTSLESEVFGRFGGRGLPVLQFGGEEAPDDHNEGILDPEDLKDLHDIQSDFDAGRVEAKVVLAPGEAQCGKTVYSLSKKGCCGSSVFDLSSQGCCKETIYEYRTQGCCNGDTVYNQATGSCHTRQSQDSSEQAPKAPTELSPGQALCGSTVYSAESNTTGCCSNKDLYDKSTQGCCGSTVYQTEVQGCCNKNTIYELSKGCPSSSNQHGGEGGGSYSGSEEARAAAQHILSQFSCGAEWPTQRATEGWAYYCAASGPKSWAMNSNCTHAWYNYSARSQSAAVNEALSVCSRDAGEDCMTLDLDGNICEVRNVEQKKLMCAGKEYDRDLQGCCQGRVYQKGSHGCCGKWIYPKGSYACCSGTPYPTSKYGCCNEEQLYKTGVLGCCVENGMELYWLGKQNCCGHPAGVCTIQYGEWSCCH